MSNQIHVTLWKMIVQEKSSLAHFTFDNNSQDWDYCQQRKCRKFNKAPTLRIISKECLTTKKGNFIEQDLNSVKEVWDWSLKMSCPSPYLNQGLLSQLLQSRQMQWNCTERFCDQNKVVYLRYSKNWPYN